MEPQWATLTVPLDHPPYDAPLYTCGDPLLRYEGQKIPEGDWEIELEDSVVQVTYNLYTALRQLRHHEKSKTLWVDALCIDQINGQERGDEVRAMARIYAQTSAVV